MRPIPARRRMLRKPVAWSSARRPRVRAPVRSETPRAGARVHAHRALDRRHHPGRPGVRPVVLRGGQRAGRDRGGNGCDQLEWAGAVAFTRRPHGRHDSSGPNATRGTWTCDSLSWGSLRRTTRDGAGLLVFERTLDCLAGARDLLGKVLQDRHRRVPDHGIRIAPCRTIQLRWRNAWVSAERAAGSVRARSRRASSAPCCLVQSLWSNARTSDAVSERRGGACPAAPIPATLRLRVQASRRPTVVSGMVYTGSEARAARPDLRVTTSLNGTATARAQPPLLGDSLVALGVVAGEVSLVALVGGLEVLHPCVEVLLE